MALQGKWKNQSRTSNKLGRLFYFMHGGRKMSDVGKLIGGGLQVVGGLIGRYMSVNPLPPAENGGIARPATRKAAVSGIATMPVSENRVGAGGHGIRIPVEELEAAATSTQAETAARLAEARGRIAQRIADAKDGDKEHLIALHNTVSAAEQAVHADLIVSAVNAL
jgi:hypothetical protein